MLMLRLSGVCLGSLILVAALLATPAVAAPEQVQTLFTADANTTALYLFKEGTGTTTAHETVQTSPQPLNGTLYGANWAVGRNGYAVATDAGYMTIPDNAAQRPASAITVEAWVKLSQPGGDLIVKEGAYFLRLGSTITLYLAVGSSSWTTISGTLPVPTGQWTHLAITFDSTTHIASIYINGVLDTAKTCGTGTLNQGTSSTWIGRNDYNSGSVVYGKIDSFRVSKIARQFLPLYSPGPGAPTPPGNLVPNGDFEMGLTGWRGDNYGDVNLMWEAAGGAASGQKCLHTLTSTGPTLRRFSCRAVRRACIRGPFPHTPAENTRSRCN